MQKFGLIMLGFVSCLALLLMGSGGPLVSQYVRQSDTTWNDLRFAATSVNPTGPTAPATPDADVPGLTFAGNADNMIHIVAQMPHGKKLGTDVYPHIHVQDTGTSVATQNWRHIYTWVNRNATWDGLWITNTFNVWNASGVANSNLFIGITNLSPPAGEALSSIIKVRLERVGSTDANNDAARLLEYDIHYEQDALGSDEELTKSF